MDVKAESEVEPKESIIQTEDARHYYPVKDVGPESLVKSRWDTLGIWQALWTFRTSWFYTMAVYTGYIIDGYEVGSGLSCLSLMPVLSGHYVWIHHRQSRVSVSTSLECIDSRFSVPASRESLVCFRQTVPM